MPGVYERGEDEEYILYGARERGESAVQCKGEEELASLPLGVVVDRLGLREFFVEHRAADGHELERRPVPQHPDLAFLYTKPVFAERRKILEREQLLLLLLHRNLCTAAAASVRTRVCTLTFRMRCHSTHRARARNQKAKV